MVITYIMHSLRLSTNRKEGFWCLCFTTRNLSSQMGIHLSIDLLFETFWRAKSTLSTNLKNETGIIGSLILIRNVHCPAIILAVWVSFTWIPFRIREIKSGIFWATIKHNKNTKRNIVLVIMTIRMSLLLYMISQYMYMASNVLLSQIWE